jgi:ribosomal protein S18 acetylase RimI-like enzyme
MLAPGVTALVALKEGGLVGAVQVLGDGQINWVIGTLIVAPSYRSQGIGRRLIAESFIATGAKRLDLLTENDGPAFYRQLPGREMAGFRLYPQNP